MDLGLEVAGLKCCWQVESNEYAIRVLQKHWPDVRRHDDVCTFNPVGPGWEVDLICGGDPCQANSAAAGPSRSKAKSFGGEFLRVVDQLRPRLVLRENPSHVRTDAPWPWQRFRAGLESLGYAVLPFRLRACCVGADHRRDRLFLLAERTDANRLRLEGRNGEASRKIESRTVPTLVGPANGNDIRTMPGLRSRAGLPNYVDRVKCVGNSVCPQVAEWIGHRLMAVTDRDAGGQDG